MHIEYLPISQYDKILCTIFTDEKYGTYGSQIEHLVTEVI